MALALARKYRPRNFASVAVQSHVSDTLRGAIARGRVAHGYLLCGPRGTGKTTLARVLAMALNCENRRSAAGRGNAASAIQPTLASEAGEPCGVCESCERIWSGGASLDVVEIDAASNRGVDDARDLRERAMYAPSGDDRYKVYIVDEAHMLTREAWNALLKVLEEPPPRVIFVFATTEPQKIAQAAAPVLSRLQRFDLRRIGPAEIRARLAEVLEAEGVTAEPEALAMIARAADGGLRDALSLTDQALSLGDGPLTAERVRQALGLVPEDEYLALLALIAERRAADVFESVARLADGGVDFGIVLSGLADLLRGQLAIVLGGSAPDLTERTRAALVDRASEFAAGDLLRMLQAIAELEPRFRRSSQQQLLLETMLVRFALMDRSVALETVLRGLAGGGAEAGGGAPQRAVRAPEPERPARAERAAAPAPAPAASLEVAPPPSPRPSPAPHAAPSASSAARDRAVLVPMVREETGAPPAGAEARADAPAPPDINRLVERWGDIVDAVRAGGGPVLMSALAHVSPSAVTAQGLVTVQLDDPNPIFAQAIESAQRELLAAVREQFSGVRRIQLRRGEGAAPAARMTTESIRVERLAAMRRRDPALDAAVDALDLELLD